MLVYIQAFYALLGIVGLLSIGILIVANYKKINREQFEESNKRWSVIVDALKEHNEALKTLVQDAQRAQEELRTEIAGLQGKVSVFEKQRISWSNRNLQLYELIQEYRSQLRALGVSTPEPNGEGA